MNILCIDIGATKVYLGIAEKQFKNIIKWNTESFLERPDKIIKEIKKDHKIESTAVALPGPLDLKNDKIYPPNIQGRNIDIEDLFDDDLYDMILINDCHAGVIGEYVFGEEKSENMVYLTISTGIGAGVVSNGDLIKGHDNNFAEIGHMYIGGDRKCGCGGRGHWEAYCSGKNIVDYAEEITNKSYKSPKHLFDEFENGNEDAVKVIKKFQKINAKAFSNIINLYNPEMIVMGGSLALNNTDTIIGDNVSMIKKNIVNPMPKINVTSLNNYSVLHGLRAICLDKFNLD
ncbi:MAG: ROK family protein [Thermoplasmatota archaeon]